MKRSCRPPFADNWRQRWYWGMEPQTPELRPPLYCGFTVRLLAWIIDKLLLTLLTLSLAAALILLGLLTFPPTKEGAFVIICCVVIISAVIKGAYYTLFHLNNGQTVGQTVLGIKVVDSAGTPPGLRQAMQRRSAHLLSLLTCGLGYLWLLFDSRKQTLHDKLAKTYVVYAE